MQQQWIHGYCDERDGIRGEKGPAWSPLLYHAAGSPRFAFPRHKIAQPRGDRRGIEGPEERGQQRDGEDPGDLAIPGLPNGTILIKSKTVAIPSQMRGKEGRWRGKPGFRSEEPRQTILGCARQPQRRPLSGTATRPSFMSLYVQLSRAESWDGLHLFRKPAHGDFIEPKNVLDKDMRNAIVKLEQRGKETRRRFEEDHKHES
ncbi:predicted protein [Chaetomium globosum CBS 148.51]|uniref:Uncharacterized protein n=1 Tax=Chaetomium globosum (strain ATCC 6205 / CBS 148.51 / DSM 1962 / NBRC 6347 / NRRL 1970) TaxID=306901 RepID=Q2H617_CHAGB|nr:uncharacterized protein CHGG_05898 [Chaetomium globosum CBS 148.51]EAQ89279.1 predicted protein [Chaetomium globosum CBS 148.51]